MPSLGMPARGTEEEIAQDVSFECYLLDRNVKRLDVCELPRKHGLECEAGRPCIDLWGPYWIETNGEEVGFQVDGSTSEK